MTGAVRRLATAQAPERLAPPHSQEAEQSVLGALLLDNSVWPVVAELLTSDAFFQFEHGLIFEAIGQLVTKGQPADVITVFENLKSRNLDDDVAGLQYLNALAQSVPSAANVRRYAEIVRERQVLRRLIGVGEDVSRVAFDPSGRSASDILADVMTKVSSLTEWAAEAEPSLGIDAGDLMNLDIPSPAYICPPFIAEGLTVIAAAPKVGKTTLMRQVAEAVNCGTSVFGQQCQQADVLFLSLEESRPLFKSKLKLMEIPEDNLRGIWLEFTWPQAAKGVAKLRTWLKKRSSGRPTLVVIDSLARFRLPPSAKGNAFAEDYNAMMLLADLCKEFTGLAICVLHHTTKAFHDDPIATISGTHGLTAAVDSYLIVTRRGNDFKLHAGGRLWTLENQDFALVRANHRWTMDGEWEEGAASLTPKQRAVIELLQGGAKTNTALCEATGQEMAAMSHMLGAMQAKGLVQRIANGWEVVRK